MSDYNPAKKSIPIKKNAILINTFLVVINARLDKFEFTMGTN